MGFSLKQKPVFWLLCISLAIFIHVSPVWCISIEGGRFHTLAAKNNGSVWGWGGNIDGQLGCGDCDDIQLSPVFVSGVANVIQVATGYGHTLALSETDTGETEVWGWGRNPSGQVGNGSASKYPVLIPQRVINLGDVKQVSCGAFHSLALMKDKTVKAWGWNFYGQVGNNSDDSLYAMPEAVEASFPDPDNPDQQVSELLDDVEVIAGGYNHSLVIRGPDNVVWAWGANHYGQLGDGTEKNNYTAVQVKIKDSFDGVEYLDNVEEIAGGRDHSIALRENENGDKEVWTWGRNNYGQLGYATLKEINVLPRRVEIENVWKIAAGYNFSLALKRDGTVWAWGSNEYGQLGQATSRSTEPVLVSGLSGVFMIAAGGYHTIALKFDGSIWICGRNDNGQIGNGTITRITDRPVVALKSRDGDVLDNVVKIGTGFDHTLAVREKVEGDKSSREVWSWGRNNHGQLGDGNPLKESSGWPAVVPGLENIEEVDGGMDHSLAINSDGEIFSWGANYTGQLGTGDLTGSDGLVPRRVSLDQSAEHVAAGYYSSYVVVNDSGQEKVYAWGDNQYYQLGIRDPEEAYYSPTWASGYYNPEKEVLYEIEQISGGFNFTTALEDERNIWSVGRNEYGQLFYGTTATLEIPSKAFDLENVDEVAAGGYHSIALIDGTVWTCGSNSFGQLGIGDEDIDFVTFPVQVETAEGPLENIEQVAAGHNHCLALSLDGDLYAWGRNHKGQLGDLTTANHLMAIKISTVEGSILQIEAGGDHSVALDDKGYVWSWGDKWQGQLGDGTEPWLANKSLLNMSRYGDFNGDGEAEIEDVILALQVLSAGYSGGQINMTMDVDGDGKVGFEDIYFIMQVAAGLRFNG